jgi:uncharacterized protein
VAIAPVAGFFALAFGLTWLCWVPTALSDGGATTAVGKLLLAAGSAGPLIATLIALAPAGQRVARARWWRRLTGLGGLVSPAGVLCVLLPVLIAQLSLDSYAFTGGIDLPASRPGEAVTLFFSTLLIGALPEELGWRGYALPEMVRGRNPLAPTLLLALAWGAWQLPLFFMKGTWQAGIEIGSAIGVVFFVNVAAQSLLMTTFYLATRCTWAAVLFHWITILMGEFWQLPVAAEIHRSLWTILLAGVVILVKPPFGIRMGESKD